MTGQQRCNLNKHNCLFVVLLLANLNMIQRHTHIVWSSSKFFNHILVSGGYWVPLSWTSLLSFLNDTCTHTLTHTLSVTLACSRPHCHWGSLPRLPAASPAGAFFPRHCFRLILSVSTAVRLLTQECGQHSSTLFYKAKQRVWDVKCRFLLVLSK